MKISDDADQPVIMCPGKKAKYECDTDGINVRFDMPTSSEYEVVCNTDQTYRDETKMQNPVLKKAKMQLKIR